ncbi:hypothetical protein DAMA08_009760 [Martiniozyma asiatica (nom. inval.)]|nr:hypothetical protein DAMA08_009760 [Martiniozyma asiatica]
MKFVCLESENYCELQNEHVKVNSKCIKISSYALEQLKLHFGDPLAPTIIYPADGELPPLAEIVDVQLHLERVEKMHREISTLAEMFPSSNLQFEIEELLSCINRERATLVDQLPAPPTETVQVQQPVDVAQGHSYYAIFITNGLLKETLSTIFSAAWKILFIFGFLLAIEVPLNVISMISAVILVLFSDNIINLITTYSERLNWRPLGTVAHRMEIVKMWTSGMADNSIAKLVSFGIDGHPGVQDGHVHPFQWPVLLLKDSVLFLVTLLPPGAAKYEQEMENREG